MLFSHDPIIKCIMHHLNYADLINVGLVNKKCNKIFKAYIRDSPSKFILYTYGEDEFVKNYFNSLSELMKNIVYRCSACIKFYNFSCDCYNLSESIEQIKTIGNVSIKKLIWCGESDNSRKYKSMLYLYYGIRKFPMHIKQGLQTTNLNVTMCYTEQLEYIEMINPSRWVDNRFVELKGKNNIKNIIEYGSNRIKFIDNIVLPLSNLI